MRYHDYQFVFGDIFQYLHYLHASFGIKRTCRLISQQYIGVIDQRTRYRHTLHLSARHLVRLFTELVTQTHLCQRIYGAFSSLGFRNARKCQRQFDICKHRLVRYQVIALENKAYRMVSVAVPVSVLEILCGFAVDVQVAVCVAVKSADYVQQCGLTAARLSQNGHELVLAEIDADTFERLDSGVTHHIVFGYLL